MTIPAQHKGILKGDVILATAVASGFIFFLLIPLHGLLRVFTENVLLVAWKDIVLSVGMIASIAYGLRNIGNNVWLSFSLLLIAMLSYIAIASGGADPLIVADGTVTKFGPICVAVFFWIAMRPVLSYGRTPASLLLIIGVSAFVALYVMLEDKLGLTMITTTEDNLPFFTRQGIIRARAFFDSPMDAGQWLWFTGLIAFLCLISESRRVAKGALFVCVSLCLVGILFTGSRGPYVLVAGSGLIFLGVSAALGRIKAPALVVLALAIVSLLSVPLLLDVASKDSAAAIRDIAESVIDRDESANVIREERWHAGLDVLLEHPLWGMGIENISHKQLVGTGNIFENTFLDYAAALGIMGLLYVVAWYWVATEAATKGVFTTGALSNQAALLIGVCLWVPWAAYGLAYPTLNTRIGAAISWAILGCAVAGLEWRNRFMHSRHG